MKNSWGKRILCLFLTLALLLGNVPVTALAEEPLLQEERSESTEEILPEITEETLPAATEETIPEPTAEETVPEPTAEAEEETEAAGEPVPEATEELLLQETAETLLGPGQTDTAVEDETDVVYDEIPFQLNPLYEGLVDPADYENWEPEVIAPSTYAVTYLTEEKAAEQIRAYMCARVESFTVTFAAGKKYEEADFKALFARAFSHTGNPTEGDYLRWQYAGWGADTSYSVSGNTYRYTANFAVPYYTTADQEEELNVAVEQLLNQLNLSGKSDYEKIKGIYDYICKNVRYDYANLKNDYYNLKFTAYAALMNKTAVCQGYSVLLYRLALTLGIDCRFVGGTGNGGPHGWNIVKLGNLYYNADSTWDAGRTNYQYFLTGPSFDVDHIRDDEYTTQTFNTAYPMASENYDPTTGLPSVIASGTCGDALTWTLTNDGALTISGTGDMPAFDSPTSLPWDSYREQITSVVIGEGVSSISDFAFYGCTNLTSASIADSVTTLGMNSFCECASLEEISLPENLTSIGWNAFCSSGLRSISFPESLEVIGGYAFLNCDNLTSVTIPGSVHTIDNSAFGYHGDLPPYDEKYPGFQITAPRASEGYFYANENGFDCITFGSIAPYCWYECSASADMSVYEVMLNTASSVMGTIRKGADIYSNRTVYDGNGEKWIRVIGRQKENAEPEWGQFTAEQMADSDYEPIRGWIRPNAVDVGTCGENLTWRLENGTLTISGTRDMANYTDVSPDGTQGTPAPWYSVRESITKIVIGEGVTSIGSWAFNNCTNVTNVSLPDSLTAIGEAAFFGCSGLTEVTIPSGITELGNLNFAYCTNLSSISLPDSLQVIGDNAFLGCTQLCSIAIPESVSYIGGGSFQGCTSLASVNIPSSVASIGMYAFFGCTALKAVTIPDTVMFIGDWAFGFYGEAKPYSKVDSFVITTPRASEGYFYAKEHDIELITQGVFVPDFMFVGVATQDLNVNAYYDDAVLGPIPKGDMVWPYVVSYMDMDDDPDQGRVMGMKDTDGSITWGKFSAEELADTSKEPIRGWVSLSGVQEVPHGECGDSLTWMLVDGVLTISGTGKMDGMVAQYIECVGPWKEYQNEIRSVVIEEGVTSIGAMCFAYCTNLESVTIPGTVETIGHFAFFGTGLKQVSIPASVREIWHAAFSNCTALERIDAEGNNADADFRVVDGVLYDKDMTRLYVYPAAKPEPTFTVPDSVTYIDDWACVSAQFTQVILPQGLTRISLDAFAGCANLESISIPSSVSTIKYGAFRLCGSLTEITFAHSSADSLSIEENAFGLNSSTNVATKILVTNATRIHSAISGYNWAASKRKVSYESRLPRTEEILLMLEDTVLGATLDADMYSGSTLTLSTQSYPEGALNEVSWTSSNTRIATVHKQTGQVTLLTPGTVTITAKAVDGSNVSKRVTLNVFYLTKTRTLTAVAQWEEGAIKNGLQPAQTAKMIVSGIGDVSDFADNPGKYLTFTSSDALIAAVDEGGTITAGTKPGTATITASVKDDPLKRKVSVRIPVIAMQTKELSVAAVAVNGEVLSELTLDKDSAPKTYTLTAQGKNYLNEVFAPNVTWVSMDPAVARVTVARDGTVTLTIPANASGECFVTATSKDLAKITARLKVTVKDYTPRLGSSSITLNSYSQQGVTLDLRESYGNAIESATLTGAPSGIWLDSDTLTLYAEGVKNSTYKNIRLDVTCENKVTYSYMLQVKVANSLPAVTVKQTQKFNLFYLDSTAELTVSAPGQTIRDVQLTDTDDFTVSYSDGTATVRYADDPAAKPDTRGTLLVYLYGYNTPVSKSITISTTTTAPKLRLSSTASTINTAWDKQSVSMQVLDSNGKVLELNEENIKVTASFATVSIDSNTLTLTLLEGSKGGTAEISVQDSNWVKPVTLKHKVTVSTKLPTLVQGKKSLTLSSYFTEQTDEMSLALSQRNLTLETVALTCTAKESEKLNVYYADGSVHAEVIDTDKAPKPGTYSYTCTWTAPNKKMVSTKVKVVVASTLPKVKLSATTVKLNSSLPEKESIQLKPTISGGTGYTLVGFEESSAWLTFSNDALQVKLTETPKNGKYAFKVYPVIRHDATKQEVTLPTALTLTVQVYSDTPKVSLSARGRLDTLNPDSTIVYTPRLTNCIGEITGVSLAGQDANKFQAHQLEDGKIVLRQLDKVDYATNVTYKVQFRVKVCGKEILSPEMKVKVTQSAVKRTVTPGSLTLYQSQRTPLTLRLTQSMGKIDEISISTKTSFELLKALGEDGFNAEIDGSTAALKLTVKNTALLKAGKSYTLYLDVTPKNNATNLKPAQVRLTVKVMK